MAKDRTDEGRGPWFVISAAVVALVVVAALALSAVNIFGGDDDSKAAPKGKDSSSSSKNESVCGLEPGKPSETTLTSAPKTEWRLVDRMAAPEVENAGPGKIEDDQFGYCFAQSPTGAVVAAGNIVASTTTPKRQLEAYEQLAVAGPGRDKILKSLKSGEYGDTNPEGVSAQIAGFRLKRYSETEAQVDIAMEIDSQYVSMPMDLRWGDGDWKVVVSDDGSVYEGGQTLSDLSGYVIWSGA